jgi:hypothetical protein
VLVVRLHYTFLVFWVGGEFWMLLYIIVVDDVVLLGIFLAAVDDIFNHVFSAVVGSL